MIICTIMCTTDQSLFEHRSHVQPPLVLGVVVVEEGGFETAFFIFDQLDANIVFIFDVVLR